MKSQFIKQTVLSALALLLTFSAFAQGKITAGIDQPFEGIDVPFTKWDYDAQTCGKFVYTPSGTSICVPANVLESADGKTVEGMVTVEYREFHSPMSILVSGINMQYDENGKAQHLETGGMYELRAYQNGMPLAISEGMEVNVKMRTYSESADYDFFKYDDEDGSWTKLPTKGTRIDNTPPLAQEAAPFWGDAAGEDDEWFGDFDNGGDWDGWEMPEIPTDTSWFQIHQFANEIFYSGGIGELGIHNYDRIISQTPIATIKSQFFIPNSGDREHVQVFVVYKTSNTVFKYNPSDFKENFYLYTDLPAKIFAILPGNRISRFPDAELAKMDLKKLNNKSFIFQMEEPGEAFNSQADVIDYLGIN